MDFQNISSQKNPKTEKNGHQMGKNGWRMYTRFAALLVGGKFFNWNCPDISFLECSIRFSPKKLFLAKIRVFWNFKELPTAGT